MTLPTAATTATFPWWQNAVVYQVYARSFADSDGDGVGDLQGIIAKLDYLHQLGVDVVWVSPFYRSPMVDNGYDISDYDDVDPMFGTLHDVDELIEGLHARGMKLMIDVVVNHCSDQHPWFVEARSRPDSPKRHWFWWRPPRPGMTPGEPGAEPTNWISFFSQPSWTYDEATGQYYLHLFTPGQPDLNWENAELRHEVYAMLRRWIDRGVDGFRFDVVNLLSKRLPLRDGPSLGGDPTLGYGFAEFTDGPRMHDFLQELNREVAGHVRGVNEKVLVTVGEMPGVTVEHAAAYTDPSRRELDMVFQFDHMAVDVEHGDRYRPAPLSLVALKAILGSWQTGLGERGWNSLYWGNHDQARAVSRFGCDDPAHRVRSAKLLATVLHLHRGTPYVYQGEELGMTNYPWERLDQFDDVEARNYTVRRLSHGDAPDRVLERLRARSRDNARSPMLWDGGPSAGFTSGTPWLPVNPNHVEINAADQVGDAGSVFHHYRRLIELRHELPVVAHGDFTMLLPDDEHIYAFTRTLERTALLAVANWSSDAVTVTIPDGGRWASAEVVITNDTGSTETIDDEGRLRLGPWEARVLLLAPDARDGTSGFNSRVG